MRTDQTEIREGEAIGPGGEKCRGIGAGFFDDGDIAGYGFPWEGNPVTGKQVPGEAEAAGHEGLERPAVFSFDIVGQGPGIEVRLHQSGAVVNDPQVKVTRGCPPATG